MYANKPMYFDADNNPVTDPSAAKYAQFGNGLRLVRGAMPQIRVKGQWVEPKLAPPK